MTIKEVLDKTVAFFKSKNIETPRLDAEILMAHGLNLERIQLYLKFDKPLKEDELQALRELVKRRSLKEPVAYILGKKDFYRYTFKVSPAVLIPRPETETLVEKAIELLKEKIILQKNSNKNFHKDLLTPELKIPVLDLGSGSGCIAISVAKEVPEVQMVAIEKSPEAFHILKENIVFNQVNNVVAMNMDAEAIEEVTATRDTFEKFDLILSNPPYVAREDKEIDSAVVSFEPHQALFAEDKGMYFLKSWMEKYCDLLNSSGYLIFEIGYKQGEEIFSFAKELSFFQNIEILKDMNGHERFIFAQKK